MISRNNNVLRAAVLACFGVAAGQAGATVDLSSGTVTGTPKFALELPTSATTLTNAGSGAGAAGLMDIKVAVPTGYAVTAANPLYVKLNLTNGASFAGAPTMGCGTAAVVSAAAGTLQLGGAGTSFAVFTIASSDTTVSGTCTVVVGDLTVSGGHSNVGLSATVEYKNGLSNAVTGVAGNLVSFVKGVAASVTAASSTVVVDATTGGIKFAAGTIPGVNTAAVGLVSYASNSSAFLATGTVKIGAGDVLGAGSGTVTVAGPAIAAALAAQGVSGVYLSNGGTACNSLDYKVAATASNSVTFTGITSANISAGVGVCLFVSGGVAQILTGQLTATVGGTALTGVTADFTTASPNISNLTSNGVTKNAYFINASTSTNKTSVLRLVNNGGNAGTITATAYNEAGAQIGTANASLGTLAVNQMKTFSSADLETALGLTGGAAPAPTAKYRVVISGGLAGFKVLNFTKDNATGNLTLSQAQDD